MGILGVVTGYKSPQATTNEAHVNNSFIGPLYQSKAWVVKHISVNSSEHKAWVYLRVDGRGKGLRCPRCGQRMGKMRERRLEVSDLPLGTASLVHLVFTAYQGSVRTAGTFIRFVQQGSMVNHKELIGLSGMLVYSVGSCRQTRSQVSFPSQRIQPDGGINRC